MPVYFRKAAATTPDSLYDVAPEDPNDYIQDPDQFRDSLPQPYRMIDKTLHTLFEEAWGFISSRENDKILRDSRIRPPQYECDYQLQDHGCAQCIASTTDGEYMLIGGPDGLAVVSTALHETVDVWQEEGVQITSLQVTSLAPAHHLASTIDDMGVARVFALAAESLFLMFTVNEHQEGSSKVIIHKCEASMDADYLGVHVQKASSEENWLEVHKLPKDSWLKELDAVPSKAASHKDLASPQPDDKAPAPPAGTATDVDGHPSDRDVSGQAATDNSRSQSPASAKGGSMEKVGHKFTAPTQALKLKPQAPLAGVTYHSPYHGSKGIDSSGDVVGTGANHLLTTAHLDQRHSVFRTLNAKRGSHEHDEVAPTPAALLQCSFHFLSPCRRLPHGLEHGSNTSVLTVIAVWWTGQTQLQFYSLGKPGKESLSDMVWPLSSPIVASCTSADSALLVLALKNNNIVLWDYPLGLSKGVTHVCDEGQIKQVQILQPSVHSPLTPTITASPPTCPTWAVLVTLTSRRAFLVNTELSGISAAEELPLQVEMEEETPTLVQAIDSAPELLVTSRQNGSIYLHDLQRCNQLCQVALPAGYQVASPWQPILAVGAKGRCMYIKGRLEDDEAGKDEENENAAGCTPRPAEQLFVFQLSSFPVLDKHLGQERTPTASPLTSNLQARLDNLLKQGLNQHSGRQQRMQRRWRQLRQESGMSRQGWETGLSSTTTPKAARQYVDDFCDDLHEDALAIHKGSNSRVKAAVHM